jgi:alpha-L-rhamnosidase
MIKADGGQLRTGILGTPYLLHVLSDHGYVKLAYDLLLRTEYPSWLYPVTKGATTIWEHWDGINENGDFFIKRMNSFNHYIFGSVLDWVYTQAAGINNVENAPGYKKIKFSPLPDSRIDWLEGALETRSGFVRSRWEKQDDMWRYEIETPVDATIVINGKEHFVKSGRYIFYDEIKL